MCNELNVYNGDTESETTLRIVTMLLQLLVSLRYPHYYTRYSTSPHNCSWFHFGIICNYLFIVYTTHLKHFYAKN